MRIPARLDPLDRALARIEWTAGGLGLGAALITAALRGPRAGAGVAGGALLSWINYRWLKAGVGSLSDPLRRGAARFALRWALLGAVLCAIFVSHLMPLGAVLGGLFAVPAATMAEALGQLFVRN